MNEVLEEGKEGERQSQLAVGDVDFPACRSPTACLPVCMPHHSKASAPIKVIRGIQRNQIAGAVDVGPSHSAVSEIADGFRRRLSSHKVSRLEGACVASADVRRDCQVRMR